LFDPRPRAFFRPDRQISQPPRAGAAQGLGQSGPWSTFPKEDEIDLTHMRHRAKEVMHAAGLRAELSMRFFRHGGFTEAADSDLTDAEMRAQGRHKSAKVLPRYAKRTMKQVAQGARKRRPPENKLKYICQNEQQHACQNGKTQDTGELSD
jgi:hypothetical protein